MDAGQLSAFLLAVHDRSHEMPVVDFKDWLLVRLKPHIRFDSALIGMGQVDDDGVAHIPSFHLYRLPEQVMADREAIKDIDVVGQRAAAALGSTVIIRVADYEPDRKKYARMLDYAACYGLLNILCTALAPTLSGTQCFISLFRQGRDDLFSECDRSLKQMLSPHMARALAANRIENLNRFSALARDRQRVRSVAARDGRVYEGDTGIVVLVRMDWPSFDGERLPAELVRQFDRATRVHVVTKHAIYDIVPTDDMFFISARERINIDDLSEREHCVAEAFASGLTHKQIAHQLTLAPATVRRHLQNVYSKLNVDTKAALIRELT